MNIARIKIIFFISALLIIGFSHVAFAAPQGGTIVTQIVGTFHDKLSTYEQVMLKYAKLLFYWCAVLEVAWLGIKSAIGASDIKDTIKNFCLVLMTAGFFLAIINNYNTWSWNLINGLKSIAGEATDLLDASDRPFTIGLELAKFLFEKTSFWDDFAHSLGLILTALIVLICFSLITMQIILIKCECIVSMCASSILLGLGATSFLRDYAVNTLKYIFAVAFKLMTMQLVLGVGVTFLNEIAAAKDTGWGQLCVTIGFCIVYYALVKTLPDIVAGIIQGSHVNSGNSLTSTVTALGAGLMGAGMAAGSGMANIGRAAQVAREQGASGVGGMISGTARNLWDATRQAGFNRDERNNTVSSSLRQRFEQASLERRGQK